METAELSSNNNSAVFFILRDDSFFAQITEGQVGRDIQPCLIAGPFREERADVLHHHIEVRVSTLFFRTTGVKFFPDARKNFYVAHLASTRPRFCKSLISLLSLALRKLGMQDAHPRACDVGEVTAGD